MKKTLRLGTFLLSLIAINTTAFAVPITAISFTGGSEYTTLEAGTFGWKYSTDIAIDVTHYGFYDFEGNGLSQSHTIGIYDFRGDLLGISTTIASGTGALLENSFRYVELASNLRLAANQTYYIGAYRAAPITQTSPYDPVFQVATANVATEIEYLASQIATGGTLSWPSLSSGSSQKGIFGPNFKFEPVETIPTPGSLILIFSGLGFIGIRKKLQS